VDWDILAHFDVINTRLQPGRSVFTRPGIVWWISYLVASCETFVSDEGSHDQT
jgi:hypothetical protein